MLDMRVAASKKYTYPALAFGLLHMCSRKYILKVYIYIYVKNAGKEGLFTDMVVKFSNLSFQFLFRE